MIVDLFGTLIPIECDDEAHRWLSQVLATSLGTDAEALYATYRKYVDKGFGSLQALVRACEEVSHRLLDLYTVEELSYLHIEAHARFSRLKPDATVFLKWLRSIPVLTAIVSDADPGVALAILRRLGIDRYFDAVVETGSYGVRKPDPRILRIVMSLTGMDSVRCGRMVVVGDSVRDLELAKNIGAELFIHVVGRAEGVQSFDRSVVQVQNLIEAVRVLEEFIYS